MNIFICHTECYAFSHHWFVGDIAESEDENLNRHLTRYDGLEDFIPATGRRLGIANGQAYRIEDE